MTAVEAVLFDVDGTLCEYERSANDVLSLAFEDVGVERFFGEREYLAAFREFAPEGDDVNEIREACFAALTREEGHDADLGHALAGAFAERRDHSNVRFLPGAERALDAIAGSCPVGVVTNGDPWMQSQKLAGLGVADRFETVIHAGYDAPAKPAPEPFHAALADMGVPDAHAVHVGNSLVSDVPGARAAGLEAAWLDDGSDVDGVEATPDYVLDSMADLVTPPWRA